MGLKDKHFFCFVLKCSITAPVLFTIVALFFFMFFIIRSLIPGSVRNCVRVCVLKQSKSRAKRATYVGDFDFCFDCWVQQCENFGRCSDSNLWSLHSVEMRLTAMGVIL